MNDAFPVFLTGLALVTFILCGATVLVDQLFLKVVSQRIPNRNFLYGCSVFGVWLMTLPASGWIIDATPLKELTWGHVGEMLFLPFLLMSLFFLGWRLIRSRN